MVLHLWIHSNLFKLTPLNDWLLFCSFFCFSISTAEINILIITHVFAQMSPYVSSEPTFLKKVPHGRRARPLRTGDRPLADTSGDSSRALL